MDIGKGEDLSVYTFLGHIIFFNHVLILPKQKTNKQINRIYTFKYFKVMKIKVLTFMLGYTFYIWGLKISLLFMKNYSQ